MIVVESKGSFKNTDRFLSKLGRLSIEDILVKYAQQGVTALSRATPLRSNVTANSWDYEIVVKKNSQSIIWTNSNVSDGIPVVILLQYGHGTGTGGYVQGVDFINPAIKPIFNDIADDVWKAVKSA